MRTLQGWTCQRGNYCTEVPDSRALLEEYAPLTMLTAGHHLLRYEVQHHLIGTQTLYSTLTQT